MIFILPTSSQFYNKDISIFTYPSFTFKIDIEKNRVSTFIDNISALKQSIFKILSTERYLFSIYNWDYGVEFQDLIGMPLYYVKVEVQRRIKEALLFDDRIIDVFDFSFANADDKSSLIIYFSVKSVFATFDMEWTVNL